ncbi:tRNA (adenosine(37)-N6)-dimethylallyltransferase MiaA [Hyphomicrobium sp.]|uniref:tRNA (adenosine(37)-N6)-dimethylallyltransferase MiaA n=1 Tax=Hyphomicrobium sp. TaxID=82 RepID=UPI001DD21604|nr:tRNA (adenosine(37)-N6)-dimethylallyltransferase MiaA [Hyphomicrobium sp.]MBY0562276.1 tRNA (adenosine(37)-N6)-dimethylallyltransferase MiaA [Hyphomicrobium sp.]
MSAEPNHTKPILIAGPTASGKSALAMAIAKQTGGEIINADSMQVYRELRVLSARPKEEEEARVPHALYGFVPAGEAYSAGRFVRDAATAIATARSAGRRPVIVGGTGLYFKALIEGLSPIPDIAADVREYWRRAGEERGAEALHDELLRVDPAMAARLAPTDTQRIVRALEVIQSTGRSLAEWQTLRGEPVVDEAETVRFAVSGDRAELHARADARFDRMMREGALDEVRALSALQLDPDLPAMRAIGVRPLLRLVAGEIGEDEARELAKAETRQYIKRQETWLKRNMITWKPVATKETTSLMRDIFAFIQR